MQQFNLYTTQFVVFRFWRYMCTSLKNHKMKMVKALFSNNFDSSSTLKMQTARCFLHWRFFLVQGVRMEAV